MTWPKKAKIPFVLDFGRVHYLLSDANIQDATKKAMNNTKTFLVEVEIFEDGKIEVIKVL